MIEQSESYRVPKRAVEVELALAGKAPIRVQVFVAMQQAHAYRRQDVLDMLEHEHAFLPARSTADSGLAVFNKETLVWLAVVPASDKGNDPADEDELFQYRHEVRLELVGSGELTGELLYTVPDDRARVADYLNAPGRFVRLWSRDKLYLVNKAFIERVVEVPLDLTAAPEPTDDDDDFEE
jgi:hypothetical protein